MGYPLRKDFPLSGYVQLAYSGVRKALHFTPLMLSQEFRNFTFTLPWVDLDSTDTALDFDDGAIEELLEDEIQDPEPPKGVNCYFIL